MELVKQSKRKGKDPLDRYYTPATVWEWVANNLKNIYGKSYMPDLVLDPCSGPGLTKTTFSAILQPHNFISNDLDPNALADSHMDASLPEMWNALTLTANSLVVTNPPFSKATEILSQAAQRFQKIVLMVRISFLEPVESRVALLNALQRNMSVVVLPRMSFTGDGKTDSTTCILLIIGAQNRFIKILGREELNKAAVTAGIERRNDAERQT